MCRVIAPLAAIVRRETVSRPSPLPPLVGASPTTGILGAPQNIRTILQRRLRIARHRVLRWFGEPIAIVERNRRRRDYTMRRTDFRSERGRHFALESATKYVA